MAHGFLHAAGRYVVVVGLALVAAAVSGASVARATQITVTTTSDENNTDGDCSLREAFQAANGNTVRDACPAGSNTDTDHIVLADGALYALTIPVAGNDGGLSGPLFVQNNTAVTDISVTVAAEGSATIAQDAVPDASVLSTAIGAKLDLTDVTIQGGSAGAGNSGGGIFVDNDATVALLRCLLRDNVADKRGGAIVNAKGTLIVQESTFEANRAGDSGGAISAGSDSVTLIDKSFFTGNVANGQFSGGGALDVNSLLTLSNSTFVNNHARTLGGAISHFDNVVADASSITQSCFIGNDADSTHDAVDVFAGSQILNAAGNWWGADDGPSGVASGHGDGVGNLVDIDPPSNVPHAVCLPLQMVANGGFQSDADDDGIPERWTGNRLTAADGRACPAEGACLFRMRGNGALKQLSHVIRHAGPAGDSYLFKARSRAQNVPTTGGAYRAQVTIVHTDGTQKTASLNFSTGKHGFERLTKSIVTAKPYDEIHVRVEYGKASGVVRFDGVSLLLQE